MARTQYLPIFRVTDYICMDELIHLAHETPPVDIWSVRMNRIIGKASHFERSGEKLWARLTIDNSDTPHADKAFGVVHQYPCRFHHDSYHLDLITVLYTELPIEKVLAYVQGREWAQKPIIS
jgi:hypothetical protein